MTGVFVESRLYFNCVEEWNSCLVIAVRLNEIRAGNTPSSNNIADTKHTYYIAFDAETAYSDLVIEPYPLEVPQKGSKEYDAYPEKMFRKYSHGGEKNRLRLLRGAAQQSNPHLSQVAYVSFMFDATKAKTGGILVDELPDSVLRDAPGFSKQHDALKDAFDPTASDGKPTFSRFWAFVTVSDSDLFTHNFADLQNRLRQDQDEPKFNNWFKEGSTKWTIQRGQVIDYDNRPWPIVPSLPMFMSEEEALHINAFSTLNIHEASVKNDQASTEIDVEMRVLEDSAGLDKINNVFLRLPSEFRSRIGANDTFHVKISNEEGDWFAVVTPHPYPYGSSQDIHAVLYRKRGEFREWPTFQFDSVLRLWETKHSEDEVVKYLYTGTPNVVKVKPRNTLTPLKKSMEAIKIMNKAHKGEVGYEDFHNNLWLRYLVGQDLRTTR
ncbi:MAG: hypothetical protein Q9180_008050, partial [Flavoplaca navasiana]